MSHRSLLEVARAARGLTQGAVARRAGTSQPTLSAYERGVRSPTLAVTERILRTLDYELGLHPRVGFREERLDNQRTFLVPDQLWRLEPTACFAPVAVQTSSGERTLDILDRGHRITSYAWLLQHGNESQMFTHLDAALLIDAWPQLHALLPVPIQNAWSPLVNATAEGWFIDRLRQSLKTGRPKPVRRSARERAIRRLAEHGLTEDEIRAVLKRQAARARR